MTDRHDLSPSRAHDDGRTYFGENQGIRHKINENVPRGLCCRNDGCVL
jgi:hypothetical protein